MPELNPLKTGDIPFPQYSVTTTQITTAIQYTKGIIYTKSPTGALVVVAATLAKGIYQAAVTPPTISVDADEIQVLGPRTRILLVDTAGGLVEGDLVNNTPNTDAVTVAANTSSVLFIGRVFEIYTKGGDGSKKKVAGTGDLVIVETVGP